MKLCLSKTYAALPPRCYDLFKIQAVNRLLYCMASEGNFQRLISLSVAWLPWHLAGSTGAGTHQSSISQSGAVTGGLE